MKKIAFIIHGRLRGNESLFTRLRETFTGNYHLNFLFTEYAGHAITLTTQAINAGAAYIICMGGDGSLNEVVNGIMQHPVAAGGQPRGLFLGLLPHGTGNDFARTIGATKNAVQLKQWIDADLHRVIDLGCVQFNNARRQSEKRYFINIADIGMGGVVAEKISGFSKIGGPNFTFQRAILSTLVSYKRQVIKAVADTFSYEGEVLNFIIANGRYFGSGMGIAPEADPADGVFAIVIAGKISVFDYIRNLGTVKKCRPINHPEVNYKTARHVSIQSPAGPQPIDMDGEFIGYSPMEVTMLPGAVKFLSATV